jgi:hypothetical protein
MEELLFKTNSRNRQLQAEEFLKRQFQSTLRDLGDKFKVEHRFLHPEKAPSCLFVSMQDIEGSIAEIFRRNEIGFDVYFGLNPRVENQRRDANQGDIRHVCAVAVDLDTEERERKKKAPYKTVAEAERALRRFRPKPSCIVNSGFGLHGYWYFEKIIPVESHLVGSGLRVYEIGSGLAKALKGDSIFDLGRVMHLPYTINHHGDPPRLCQVIETNDLFYDLDDFKDYRGRKLITSVSNEADQPDEIDLSEKFNNAVNTRDAEMLVERLKISSRIKDLILKGSIDNYPSRSERDQAIVTALTKPYKERHPPYSKTTIEAIFLNPVFGCSKRIQEKGARALEYDIEKARKYRQEDENKEKPLSLEVESPTCNDGRRLLTLGDLISTDLPDPPALVEGGLAPGTGYTLLAGEPKAAKTTLTLQLCLSLISGKPFLDQFPVHSAPRILYVYAEGSPSMLQNIVKPQIQGGDWNIVDKDMERLVFCDGRGISLNTKKGFDKLKSLIGEHTANVCVLDPIGLIYTRNTKDTDAVADFTASLNSISASTGVGWFLIGHVRKPRQEDSSQSFIHRILGSTAWIAYAEAIWGLQKAHIHRSDRLKKLQFLLRRAVTPPPLYLALDPNTRLFTVSEEGASHRFVDVEDIVLELRRFEPEGIAATRFAEECAMKYGVTDEYIFRLLNAAKLQGLANKGDGRYGKWRAASER